MKKFSNPHKTATGEDRAFVALKALKTLWFNTGTLCNIQCANCYIESSPTNDRLVYLTLDDVRPFVEEIAADRLPVEQLAFTGGEPFMNPQMIDILTLSLEAGFEVLVLTNAMQPLMRPKVQAGLLALHKRFADKIIMRVSLDSYDRALHDTEREAGAFDRALVGLQWLSLNGFRLHIAGRQWGEADKVNGYEKLLSAHNIKLDTLSEQALMFFTEMDGDESVPEITTQCWDTLKVDPNDMMCASSRMVVKYKGEARARLTPCTLLPYEKEFVLGKTLADSNKKVYLNHRHCAKFCVLGGSSCA